MPIPLLFWGISALVFGGGAAAGYLSRNGEVARYRQAVQALQAEVRRLHGVIREQQEQIAVLKKKYQAAHMLNFIRKQVYDQQMKSILMESYLQKEILHLYNRHLRQEALSGEETEFLTIMQSQDSDPGALDKALLYIDRKYGAQIRERMLPVDEMKREMEFAEKLSVDGGPHGC